MTALTLIQIPYDSGRFNQRMGRGPTEVIANGVSGVLQRSGFAVTEAVIQLPDACFGEGNALVELQRGGCGAARNALAHQSRPIFLSGNCGPAALSAMAALGVRSTGMIWFDAHADFNTPETSPSGFFDGMGLAILVGDCWAELARRFADFEAVRPEQIVQVGVRDCDPGEERRLAESRIRRIAAPDLAQLESALADLAPRVAQIYVHVDVDVLDLSEGRANTYACAGGVSLDDLLAALEMIGRARPIAAGSVASYDPGADADGAIGRAIPRIIEALAR